MVDVDAAWDCYVWGDGTVNRGEDHENKGGLERKPYCFLALWPNTHSTIRSTHSLAQGSQYSLVPLRCIAMLTPPHSLASTESFLARKQVGAGS